MPDVPVSSSHQANILGTGDIMRNLIIASIVLAGGVGYFMLGNESETSPTSDTRAEAVATEVSQQETPSSSTRSTVRGKRAPSLSPPVRLKAEEDGDRDQRRLRREERRQQRFDGFDTNGDGELDEEERSAIRQARMNRRVERNLDFFDSNGDGELDEDETAMRDQARRDIMNDRATQMIGDTDANDDGLISRSEVETGGQRMRRILADFEGVDSDGDEQVSPEELQEAMLSRRAGRDERGRPAVRPNEWE
jgi:hypothetical protein